MFDLFGAEMPLAVRFFLAFLIVLGLIGAAAWAVRRFGSARLGGAVRGRQPRLAVIDYASVDARRRLILVRRDNVEHLVMIGGPTDVVVESNIVRAAPAAREATMPRGPVAAEPPPRTLPLPEAASDGSWPLQPEPPAVPRRAPRIEPTVEEYPSVAPQQVETPQRLPRETLSALADDIAAIPVPAAPAVNPISPRVRSAPPARPQPAEPRAEPRVEIRQETRQEARQEARHESRQEVRQEPRVPAQPAAPEPSAADQSLAEMAQRLEAALRRPKVSDTRDPRPATAPATMDADEAETPSLPPAPPPRAARPPEAKPARADAKPKEGSREGKALYDTLEQEMASLLGRPTGKT